MQIQSQPPRILVIDRSLVTRKIIQTHLGREGYQVVAVETMALALQTFTPFSPPDLLFTEWNLTRIRYFRKILPDVRIVVLFASRNILIRVIGKVVGANKFTLKTIEAILSWFEVDGCVFKPLTVQKLSEVVRTQLSLF